jgi:hypothetical protein
MDDNEETEEFKTAGYSSVGPQSSNSIESIIPVERESFEVQSQRSRDVVTDTSSSSSTFIRFLRFHRGLCSNLMQNKSNVFLKAAPHKSYHLLYFFPPQHLRHNLVYQIFTNYLRRIYLRVSPHQYLRQLTASSAFFKARLGVQHMCLIRQSLSHRNPMYLLSRP